MTFMSLPDFGDETDMGMMFDLFPAFGPVDVTGAKRHAFTINTGGIGDMQMR